MVTIKSATTAQELEAVVRIQHEVFSSEQGIPEDLCDEDNDIAHHVLALADEQPVGTARLICQQNGGGELARVAVLPSHRTGGIGRQLIQALESVAVRQGLTGITLHPHKYLETYYSALGYERSNDVVEVVGGHELITMHKRVS